MSHYKRGYRVERLAKLKLEGMGYLVIRSGGSKSVDLIAILKKDNLKEQPIIRAIMVTLNDTPSKKRKDREYLKELPPIVSKELWLYKKGNWLIEEVGDE